MHKFFIVSIFLLFVSGTAISQIKKSKKTKQHHIITIIDSSEYKWFYCGKGEIKPKFGADSNAWNIYLQQNVIASVPKMNGAPVGKYEVIVQFIVDKYGVIVEPPVPLTHSGYGMEEEVIRIIQTSPKWIPATQNGRVISYRMRQSFIFTVSEPLITGITHFFSANSS